MIFNGALIGMLNSKFEARHKLLETKMDALSVQITDMRELWRSELRRVEEVIDARLKHLEER